MARPQLLCCSLLYLAPLLLFSARLGDADVSPVECSTGAGMTQGVVPTPHRHTNGTTQWVFSKSLVLSLLGRW